MSNSIITEGADYVRTRLMSRRIAVLYLLLLATLIVSFAALPSPGSLLAPAGFLLLAIIVFRLWDDLADLPHDRRHHPQRVLVTVERLLPFAVAVVVGLLALAFLLRHDSRRLAAFLLLAGLLALLYHSASGTRIARSLRAALLLVKYPVFLFLAGSHSPRAWFCAATGYLLIAVYEFSDDPAIRGAGTLRFTAGVAAGLALVSAFYYIEGVLS